MKIFKLILMMIFVFFFIIADINAKVAASDSSSPTIGEGTTIYRERIIDNDKKETMTFEDQKLIKMTIALFEIKPSDTINTKRSEIRIEEGQKCSLQFVTGLHKERHHLDYDAGSKAEMLNIYLTPSIVEGKGVEVLIETSYLMALESGKGSAVFKKNSIKTDIVRNYEEIVVELFNNKEKNKKIVLSITPYIEIIPGPEKYPGLVKFKLVTPILIMNEELLYRNTKTPDFISATESGKDNGVNCYINYFVRKNDIGDFLLSVKPFKGAKKIGIIDNKVLKFKYRNDMFELISLEQILPLEGKWIVYGKHVPVRKIKGSKFERHPFFKGKGGVLVICSKDTESLLW
ncbi:MAG: hypothetical protein KAS21_02895 [Candidatus Aminicenantes bacterium]|nr:hypothetical protein [Candidatus Aminicenantes bacterium]